MKKTLFLLASLMVMVCMICSCGGSGSSDSEKVVSLSLGVSCPAGERSISSTATNMLASATYEYKATAKWVGSDFGAAPQGTQTEWTKFTVDNTRKGSVGLFAVGEWEFEVRIIKEGTNYATNKTDFVLLYETAVETASSKKVKTTYVNPTVTDPIVIDVVKATDITGKGYIKVDAVKAPTCSASEKLVLTYGKIGASATATVNLTAGTAADGYTPWSTSTNVEVDPGIYWVTLTRNDGTNNVGASTTQVEIFKGCTETVSGSVESGKWVEVALAIKGVKTLECEFTGTAVSPATWLEVTKGESFSFGVKGTLTSDLADDSIKYYFCCNGDITEITSSISNNVYSWATTSIAKGDYEVSIIATDKDGTMATSPNNLFIKVK